MRSIYVIIFLLTVLIFLFMAEPVWGMLAKSQTEIQTVEQRIIELIADHNDDPTAHIGTNRAITVHRENETLDHVPGAVLADKSTFREIVHRPTFESLTSWQTQGDVSTPDFPVVQLYIEDGAVQKSVIRTQMLVPVNYLNSGFNMMFQVAFTWQGSNNDLEFWLGLGANSVAPNDGFGFVYDATSFLPYTSGTSGLNFGAPIGVDINEFNIIRAQYNADALQVDFYVNGVLVESMSVDPSEWASDAGPQIGAEITNANDGSLLITDLTFARALINS